MSTVPSIALRDGWRAHRFSLAGAQLAGQSTTSAASNFDSGSDPHNAILRADPLHSF